MYRLAKQQGKRITPGRCSRLDARSRYVRIPSPADVRRSDFRGDERSFLRVCEASRLLWRQTARQAAKGPWLHQREVRRALSPENLKRLREAAMARGADPDAAVSEFTRKVFA
jgi:hypothetical protein